MTWPELIEALLRWRGLRRRDRRLRRELGELGRALTACTAKLQEQILAARLELGGQVAEVTSLGLAARAQLRHLEIRIEVLEDEARRRGA